MSETNNAVDTITIGDKVYDKNSVTPSAYFEYVKGMKTKLDREEYNVLIDNILSMLKKTTITGQTAMAKELTHQFDLAIRELNAADSGFDIFVDRKDIERYITEIEAKSVKIIELENFERDIPDELVDKIIAAKEIFDQIYIVFTDYTKKETKKVAKKRRDKDPIMFGAFKCPESDDTKTYVEDRFFFIADWVDDDCDLTLEEVCRTSKRKHRKDITYRMEVPKDKEAVKVLLDSYKKESLKDTELERVNLFGRIKKKLTKKKEEKK